MFGVGFGEILAVCLVALFFMGTDDFVKLARLAAKGLREFRVLKQDLKDSVEKNLNETPDSAGSHKKEEKEGRNLDG